MYIQKNSNKKNLEIFFVKIYIYTTFNNTIITITDNFGNVLSWISAGCCNFKGSKKSTPHTATVIAKKISEKFFSFLNHNVKQVLASIFIKGPGIGAESAIRTLSTFFLIKDISNITNIPHNGCRLKKMRRV